MAGHNNNYIHFCCKQNSTAHLTVLKTSSYNGSFCLAGMQQRSSHTGSVQEVVSVAQEYPVAMHLHDHHVPKHPRSSYYVQLLLCQSVNAAVTNVLLGCVSPSGVGHCHCSQRYSDELMPAAASINPQTHVIHTHTNSFRFRLICHFSVLVMAAGYRKGFPIKILALLQQDLLQAKKMSFRMSNHQCQSSEGICTTHAISSQITPTSVASSYQYSSFMPWLIVYQHAYNVTVCG